MPHGENVAQVDTFSETRHILLYFCNEAFEFARTHTDVVLSCSRSKCKRIGFLQGQALEQQVATTLRVWEACHSLPPQRLVDLPQQAMRVRRRPAASHPLQSQVRAASHTHERLNSFPCQPVTLRTGNLLARGELFPQVRRRFKVTVYCIEIMMMCSVPANSVQVEKCQKGGSFHPVHVLSS